MVKSMKKVKKIIAVALVFTMLFASQVTAFAADTKATKSANKDMSIALMPGVTGHSNTVTFNFSGLPDNAIVKEVTVDCSSASVFGGKGAILVCVYDRDKYCISESWLCIYRGYKIFKT